MDSWASISPGRLELAGLVWGISEGFLNFWITPSPNWGPTPPPDLAKSLICPRSEAQPPLISNCSQGSGVFLKFCLRARVPGPPCLLLLLQPVAKKTKSNLSQVEEWALQVHRTPSNGDGGLSLEISQVSASNPKVGVGAFHRGPTFHQGWEDDVVYGRQMKTKTSEQQQYQEHLLR